jgi:purine-binding chemotaxis protein CheW
MPTLAHHQGGSLLETAVISALVCRVESRLLALPLSEVTETMRPLPVSAMPGAPPFVRGAAIVRGEAVPVLDGGLLLGGQAPGAAGRFVILRVGGRPVALAVDEVLGVRALSGAVLAELPPLLQNATSVDSVGILDAQLLVLLQSARLVPESVWSALAREQT